MGKAIRFYKPDSEYYELSNFYSTRPIIIDGETYLNVEQYFQVQKFMGSEATPRSHEYADIIRAADTPLKVKLLGSQNKTHRFGRNWVVNKVTDRRLVVDVIAEYADVKIRSDWDDIRDVVMKRALVAKFTQDDWLCKLLKGTGEAQLIENSSKDCYWSIGRDGTGTNRLGQLLMNVRDELSKA